MKRIGILFTGGTLDALGTRRLDLAWYIEAASRLAPGEFMAGVPELNDIAIVEEVPFRRLNSHALNDADWLDLAHEIDRVLETEETFDGLVIGHGTNTLEETAYFLSLVLRTTRPVVLVGAMRPASALSSDGQLNVLNAVRVASSNGAAASGVMVVLNDTIYAPRGVTKTSTYRVQAFADPNYGPIGYADADGSVVWRREELRSRHASSPFDLAGVTALPRVDLVTSHVGADGTHIRASVEAGAEGLVSAGTGAGRPTPAEDEAIDWALTHNVIVCQSSRVGSGRVVRSPALRRRGIVAADDLSPWKARILLSLALTTTNDPEDVQHFFDTL